MKWFSVLLYFLASILGWFFFCLDPIADAASAPLADTLLSIAAILLLPIGLIPAFRFGSVLFVSLIWVASAYFRHPVWSFEETLLTAVLWLVCLTAALFSTYRPLETKAPLKSQVIPSTLPFRGKTQLFLFQTAWLVGYTLTATAPSSSHATYFITAWTLIMLFLCQAFFWPIPASYGWLGHDERQLIYPSGTPRLRQEIHTWLFLGFLILAIIAYFVLPTYF